MISKFGFVAISLILQLVTTSGVKLSGPCPTMPPTSRYKRATVYYLLAIVPFSADHPSNIFKENAVSLAFSGAFNAEPPEGLKVYFIGFGIIGTFENNKNESFFLRTIVMDGYEMETLCSVPIFEEVRIWHEGPFSFLWSCVNSQSQMEHDEALLVFKTTNRFHETELLDVSGKVVSKVMMTHLKLVGDTQKQISYICPESLRNVDVSGGIPIIIMIVGVLLVIYCMFNVKNQKVGAVSGT